MKQTPSTANLLVLLCSVAFFFTLSGCAEDTTVSPEEKVRVATMNVAEYERMLAESRASAEECKVVYDSLLVFFGNQHEPGFRKLSQPILQEVSYAIDRHLGTADTLHTRLIEFHYNINHYGPGTELIELKNPE